MEISSPSDNKNLELALQASKETTLNGHIPQEKVAELQPCISVEDINIKIQETCKLCGKMRSSEDHKNGKMASNGFVDHKTDNPICEECMTPTGSAKDLSEDVEVVNKRDSGFHTLKRDETENVDTGQKAESALSSASSADSAVSMETCTPSDDTIDGKSGSTPPSIVVDECNNIPNASESLKVDFNISEDVFQDDSALNGTATPEKESPKMLAEKLYNFDGYKRTEIAKMLGKNSEYSQQAAKEYLQHFNFANLSLIEAYRQFLSHFALLGETQERERIISHFSQRYMECNSDFLDQNPDSVHTLVCALTLLNTDLHGNVGLSSGRKKMTYKQFAFNLSGLMSNNADYPKDLLVSLYASVKKHPLPWGGKEKRKVPRSTSMRHNTEIDSHRTPTKIVNRSLSTRSPGKSGKTPVASSQAGLGRSTKVKSLSHNHGLLWRKAYMESDGKKVSIGKRGWKVYSVTLQNLELHIVKKGSTEAKTISIHHCLAEETTTDSKRPHVFRITHADSRVTLYQASSDKEAKQWVRAINKAAALLSAAPLCSPVGSQLVFRRALLPSAPSTLPASNQLNKLHSLLKEHEQDLTETQKLAAEYDKSHSEQRAEYFHDKIAYLKSEIRKYDYYVKILQMHIRTSSLSGEDYRSNNDATDNTSLASMTPSEPPLASPSAIYNTDQFVFPDSDPRSETNSVLSPPSHLVTSPQHLHLSLSPTSSLPNLSPILESPTKVSVAGTQAPGSLRRRRGRELYESSLNGGTPPSPRNVNNSNEKSALHTTPKSRSRHHGVGSSSTPNAKDPAQPPSSQIQVAIETTVIGLKTLPGNQEPFPVKRYEMRIADMAPDYISPTEPIPPSPKPQEAETRSAPTQVLYRPALENLTLSRVKGRNEKRGIERYSYMQAVSPLEES